MVILNRLKSVFPINMQAMTALHLLQQRGLCRWDEEGCECVGNLDALTLTVLQLLTARRYLDASELAHEHGEPAAAARPFQRFFLCVGGWVVCLFVIASGA